MNHYFALIPFCILFLSFTLFRVALTYSAFIALLSCVALTGASPTALTKTLEFLFEIGLIIFGAFFFVEAAERKGVIHSLADLVREVTSNRLAQAILVSFPLVLVVEGSSGFGTPILIIAPLLRALGLPLILCAILPLINMVNGIPFGALGTPIRLGFSDPTNVAYFTVLASYPLYWITPLVSLLLIRKKITLSTSEKKPLWVLWIIFLSCVYAITCLKVSQHNPEFPALAGGLLTFIVGIFSVHFLEHRKLLFPHHRKGLLVYTLLLAVLWMGKQIWMDEKIPGTHLRIFNPGWVFILFALFLSRTHELIKPAALRARRTLAVLFCMTFIVQQLKISGSVDLLLTQLPSFFSHEGAMILGWLGAITIGTATVGNLFLSPLVDPLSAGLLATGTAIGVQLAFQMIIAVKSILKDDITEKEILKYILPISLTFLAIAKITSLA